MLVRRFLFLVLAGLCSCTSSAVLNPQTPENCQRSSPLSAPMYTTVLPTGQRGPSDLNGNPVLPKTSSAVTAKLPTNDWWSSLGWKRYVDNPYSTPMYAHPWVVQAKAGGFGLSYPTKLFITGDTRKYEYTYTEDFYLSVPGLASPDAKVDGFSDWTVTALVSDGARSLKATFGHGLAYVYARKAGGNAQLVFAAPPRIFSNQGAGVGFAVGDRLYAVFGPSGSTWTLSGSVLESSLAGKDYFSVAVLPDELPATLSLFAAHAHAEVTDTQVSWAHDETSGTVVTRYAFTTVPREGTETVPLAALYRHQWLNATAQTTAAATGHHYLSPRGDMKLYRSSSLVTRTALGGVLPALPLAASVNTTTLKAHVDEVLATDIPMPDVLDTYWTGKRMQRLALLLPIADQIGYSGAKTKILTALKAKLADWFNASDGKNLFYYDNAWGTVIGYPAGYGSDTELNDHHFHYGYFIMAAAYIAQYDPSWLTEENRASITDLIKDAANYDRTDARFPFLRNFDPYAGHSWASGHSGFAAGNNQESSSESMNFNTAVILWGTQTQDKAIRELGTFLYANETAALGQYWFDADKAVYPSAYTHPVVGMVWGDGASYSTWFTAEPEMIHGINFLPISGGSFYLGRFANALQANRAHLVQQNGGEPRLWFDVLLNTYALSDPSVSLSSFLSPPPDAQYEEGESKAHTLHWLSGLNALGTVDATVQSSSPTALAFTKAGVRTYVAYNPSNSPATVYFSDGKACALPGAGTFALTQCAAGALPPKSEDELPSAPTASCP